MLSHRNFSSLLSKLAGVFDIDKHDGLLSVLPLHHTFEFTAGLLMPLMRGAQITYLDEIDADALSGAFDEGNITGMVGVPALWQLLQRKIDKQRRRARRAGRSALRLARRGEPQAARPDAAGARRADRCSTGASCCSGRCTRSSAGGCGCSSPAARRCRPRPMKAFRGLGFNLFEGYGLTEASPVLTVNRPGTRLLAGSVGEPLPGIDVRSTIPTRAAWARSIACGPERHARLLREPRGHRRGDRKDGWLHTGDLGRFDDDERLYIVGRKKEMILGPSGENVYPDELEELYRDSPYVKELSIVGLPEESGAARRSRCLVVPEYEPSGEELEREAVRERLAEHIKSVSAKLPLHKRVKMLHFTDLELPKTATRKVKRKLVVEEMQKLERLKKRAERDAGGGAGRRQLDPRPSLPPSPNKPRDKAYGQARLEELGFDSLMYTELGVALEAAGVAVPDAGNADLTGVETVDDFETA